MSVSKQDWVLIRNSAVWQEFQQQVLNSLGSYGAEIIDRTVANPDRDMFLRGVIYALKEIASWEPDYIPEDEETEA